MHRREALCQNAQPEGRRWFAAERNRKIKCKHMSSTNKVLTDAAMSPTIQMPRSE